MLLMWTEKLSVGVKALDHDHKKMIHMVNELHGAIQSADAMGQVDGQEIEIALHRLQNYTLYHFTREEMLLSDTGYANLEHHKKEHQALLATLTEMSERFTGSTDPVQATELMQFMYDWLSHHINVTDKRYTEHLNGNGIF